ncbi:hypothetical protein OUZ56_000086 [Daphnia magna]|uniref:Uncharacterized protein n=1 Tax=Daphnia magna TaxID=35525 RepID=A0ABQ9ZYN9_9CRUS|nr:hypothetical protein OUZ56_000086 [Daphnia magna]
MKWRVLCLPEQLETDAEMTAEIKVVQHVDDVVQAVLVPPSQVVQNADFHKGLVMESFLIPKQENEEDVSKKIEFKIRQSDRQVMSLSYAICHRVSHFQLNVKSCHSRVIDPGHDLTLTGYIFPIGILHPSYRQAEVSCVGIELVTA